MFTISLIGQKGGVGKTTIALGLAVAAARAGHAAVIVDLDPQASAAKWKGRRVDENPTVVSADVSRLKPIINTSRTSGVDFVFIDTAGRKDDSALSAARASDLVLIPTRPNILEAETLPAVSVLLKLAGNPPAFVLLNCIHPSAELHSSICRSSRPDQHVPDDQAVAQIGHSGSVVSVTFSPDGRNAVSAGGISSSGM
jgi:chromosome partitioning protein